MVDMMGLKINLPHIFSCSDFPQNPNCLSDELVPSMISLPLEDPRLQITIFMANEKLPVGAILAMSGKWMPYWQFLAEGNFGEIQIRVPKLDVASQKDITNALFGVGIQDAFDPFMANFTRITDKIGISASNVSEILINRYTTLWRFRATRILSLEIYDPKLSKSAHIKILLSLKNLTFFQKIN